MLKLHVLSPLACIMTPSSPATPLHSPLPALNMTFMIIVFRQLLWLLFKRCRLYELPIGTSCHFLPRFFSPYKSWLAFGLIIFYILPSPRHSAVPLMSSPRPFIDDKNDFDQWFVSRDIDVCVSCHFLPRATTFFFPPPFPPATLAFRSKNLLFLTSL